MVNKINKFKTKTNCFFPVACIVVTPANAVVPVGDFVFGDSITFECEAGYTLSGTATANCGADGTLGTVDAACTAGLLQTFLLDFVFILFRSRYSLWPTYIGPDWRLIEAYKV